MKSTLKQILDREGILVLDGSMGTALENLGADLNNKLWTARVLADRPELLWQAGADVLLFETEPSLMEAEVEAQIAEELGAPYWISFSCCDGRHNCEGQLLADCARQLARNYPHLQAIGVNCTKPEYIASLIGELKGASDLPIIVYPNSGEEYDPQTKTWHGVGTDRRFGDYALDYMKAGAVAVGGCCTTVANHIRQVVAARKTYTGK